MKKITVLLLALVLVCASAFATFSLSFGAGYGVIDYGFNNLRGKNSTQHGVAGFVGVDFALDNGLSFYDDVEYNCVFEDEPLHFVTERTGVGYTFNMRKVSIMVGAGPEVQVAFYGDLAPAFNFGIDTKFKTTLFFTDNFGLSFQLTPSCEFIALDRVGCSSGVTVSANALLGCTFRF